MNWIDNAVAARHLRLEKMWFEAQNLIGEAWRGFFQKSDMENVAPGVAFCRAEPLAAG